MEKNTDERRKKQYGRENQRELKCLYNKLIISH